VVDGTGNGWYYADVALSADRILEVAPRGTLSPSDAREVIDVTGLVVAPGFIDINGQSDYALLEDGRSLNKIHQGITTEIMGENSTPAPRNELITGPLDPSDTTGVRRARDWSRFAGWLEEMERGGISLNVASFVGASTVRRYAMGMADRSPTPAELDTMKAVVTRAMEDGALGVASGLIYPPGAYASTDELVELARAAGEGGGIYISHIRSESSGLLQALEEAVEIGRRSRAPVEIYHLKAAGVENWPLAGASWDRIEAARGQGIDVSATMYPYTAASTSLTACLPPWVQADDRLLENLADPEARARIAAEVEDGSQGWENWCQLATPEGSMVVGISSDDLKPLQGRRLSEIAAERSSSWIETVMDLILENEGGVGMVYFAMSEENVSRQLTLPWMKFGSDSGSWDPQTATSMTHPRTYGTYPRILGRYVREEGVLPLEEAIRKMTSAVADRVGLRSRGQIREFFFADIVVFDESAIREESTFTDPHRLATGVRHVFVNGRPVILGGEYTGALPGRFLKGQGTR
jgi:N-acyl-D-amino-acid deacylase